MANSSHYEISNTEDPNPITNLLLGTWFAILAAIGVPLNIYIVISTIKVTEIRTFPLNILIVSLAIADTFTLISFVLHLPYAITSADIYYKVNGATTGVAALVGICISPF